jgi:hypothetical protein
MVPRFLTRSVVATAMLGGGLLIGVAFAPVGAQQTAPADGQVAVRSDGAVYLIANGQRRWVATVSITDEELNAYPEGEPIFGGLAPMGASSASAPPPASASAVPAASPSAGGGLPSAPWTTPPSTGGAQPTATTTTAGGGTGIPGTTGANLTPTAISTPTGAISQIDPQLPLEVDVDGPPKAEPGDRVTVNLKTNVGASCELVVRWPNGTEASQPSKTADSRGRCQYEIDVPTSATPGVGALKGTVREGGRVSTQEVELEVVPAA